MDELMTPLEWAKSTIRIGENGFVPASTIAAARAIIEMDKALKSAIEAFLSDSKHGPQKTILGDDVIYHLDGQILGSALERCRAALKHVRGES